MFLFLPVRRPPKPPRPPLPLAPKPAEPLLAPHTRSLIELDEPEPGCSTHTPTHSARVQTDFTPALEPLTPISADSSYITHNSQSQASVKQEVTAQPRPRPRSKLSMQSVIEEELQDQPITREVKVQTLVRLKDDATQSIFAGFNNTLIDSASNKYLQDLLDVFTCDQPDVQSDQHDVSDHNFESNEKESISLESCSVAAEPVKAVKRPQPRPRTQKPKPSINAKPSDPAALSMEETKTSAEEQNKPAVHPVPAPRPLGKKLSGSQQQGSSEEKNELCPQRPPPRPPLAARKSGAFTQEDGAQSANVAFNSSETRRSGDPSSTATASGKPVAITSGRGRGKCKDVFGCFANVLLKDFTLILFHLLGKEPRKKFYTKLRH